MATTDLQSLQIRPDAADPLLAQQQTRFNSLVQDLLQWRSALAAWMDTMSRLRNAVEPLHQDLRAAWRQWVLALDHASLQPGLSRAEREQLQQLLREALAPLLEPGADPELASLAARHAGPGTCAPARQEVARPGGQDAGSPQDGEQDWEQQAAEAAARRAELAARRRADSRSRRRSKDQQAVSQSLREVYRRLASALHPDREADARQRAHKTQLMQQANQAYAQQNLLALLELQLQAEQIDAARLAGLDLRRLQHYVAVLQEQLAELQSEARRLEAQFRAATGLAPGSGLQPGKARRMISAQVRRLQAQLLDLRKEGRHLADPEALKAWLRQQRKARQPPG